MNLGEIIFNDIMKDFNKKYKEYDSLKEYLNSFTKEELYRASLKSGLTTSNKELSKVLVVNTSTKDKMVDYVINNLDTIIKSHLLSLDDRDLEILNEVLNNGNSIVVENNKVPLLLITNLGHSILMHVYYDKKKETVNINVQKDIATEIKKILKNKSFIKEHKDINKFENNIEVLLEVYGIIDLDNLYKIYNEVFEEIDKEIFDNYLLHLIIKDGPLTEVRVNDINYLTTMILDEIEAEEYVKSLTDEYKIYPKEFYFDVFNRRYLKNLKSYEILYDYLLKNYDLDLNEEVEIFELIVCDYIYQLQESKLRAKESILKNLDRYFEINSKEKNIIINYLNKIYYDYPKWKKKGNI